MVPQAGVGEKTRRTGAARFRRGDGELNGGAPRRSWTVEAVGAVGSVTRDMVYRRALVLGDLLSAALALGLGLGVMGEDDVSLPVVLILPVVVLVSKVIGLYDRDEHLLHKTTLDEAPALFQVSAIYALLMWLGSSAFVAGELGRDQVLGLWGLLFVAMLTARAAARRIARRGTTVERCIVVGDTRSTERLRAALAHTHTLKAEIVGRVEMPHGRRRDDPPPPRAADPRGVPLLGRSESLAATLVEHDIERVIIAPGASYSDEILELIRLVKSVGVRVSVLPRLFEVIGSSVEFDDVDGITLLGVRRFGLSRSSRMLKRSLDLVVAGAGLVVISPLLLVAAIAIKLDSPGPVFFRQRRIGRDGEAFEMLKFRTMVVGADAKKRDLLDLNEAAEGLFKIQNDPRITRVGACLRRSSLDELPQLLNVLKGDMSLVGPRPLVADEDCRIEGLHRRRLHVMPGMTGYWQVLGSSRIPLHEMVKIDYLYGANWSLWMDLKILLRTVPYMLGRRAL